MVEQGRIDESPIFSGAGSILPLGGIIMTEVFMVLASSMFEAMNLRISTASYQLLSKHGDPLCQEDIHLVAKATGGYSGSDLTHLARDAAFGPIRDVPSEGLLHISKSKLRPIQLNDFRNALQRVRVSITGDYLERYLDWNRRFGDGAAGFSEREEVGAAAVFRQLFPRAWAAA
eukprot:maker-scaffold238_size242079-snap-gene-1.19 protein:Tk10921 transcript:maker-scaffold238_size242079-snap-gene-1.19-mRNA-1 annotation:"unnamed protein product"